MHSSAPLPSLQGHPAELRRVEEHMAAAPALLEAMRTPVLMQARSAAAENRLPTPPPRLTHSPLSQIAIAAYRYGGEGDGGGPLSSLPPAGGGLDDAELAALDARTPVAGLYVRAERIFARQVGGVIPAAHRSPAPSVPLWPLRAGVARQPGGPRMGHSCGACSAVAAPPPGLVSRCPRRLCDAR